MIREVFVRNSLRSPNILSLRRKWLVLFPFILFSALSGCKKEIVPKAFYPRSDHEAYEHSLETANLLNTALGIEWTEAATKSLHSPTDIVLPFQEAFYFSSKTPDAIGYRFFVKRGLRIEVKIQVQSSDSLRLFANLFRQTEGKESRLIHVATADEDSLSIKFRTRVDALYILRLQPELLRGGRFKVVIHETPSLKFPVEGKTSRSIQSFFGDPRDGGSRSHHGVDVFASRHTPVLAPVRSQVLRIGEGKVGGRYVWLWEPKRSLYLYFAHLETQLVTRSVWVNPGDTIGTVGNSGNAIRTRPHLHFGVYINGPVDPWHFILETDTVPNPVLADTKVVSKQIRLTTLTIIRSGPNLKALSIDTLEQHSIMEVTAATGKFYRILLPEGTAGYIPYDRIELVTNEISNGSVPESFDVLESPEQKGIPIANLTADDPFQVLGRYKDYFFIRTQQGIEGWMSVSSNLSI